MAVDSESNGRMMRKQVDTCYLGNIIREYLKVYLILLLQFGLSLNKKMKCAGGRFLAY